MVDKKLLKNFLSIVIQKLKQH